MRSPGSWVGSLLGGVIWPAHLPFRTFDPQRGLARLHSDDVSDRRDFILPFNSGSRIGKLGRPRHSRGCLPLRGFSDASPTYQASAQRLVCTLGEQRPVNARAHSLAANSHVVAVRHQPLNWPIGVGRWR